MLAMDIHGTHILLKHPTVILLAVYITCMDFHAYTVCSGERVVNSDAA